MPRLSREGDAPDFAGRGMGKAAWGRGFSGFVKISRVAVLGGFAGGKFVAAFPRHLDVSG